VNCENDLNKITLAGGYFSDGENGLGEHQGDQIGRIFASLIFLSLGNFMKTT
jgi:hypothetical protein